MTEEQKPLTFWQVLTSTLSSFAGIQNTETRERDFTRGKAKHFIFAGLLLTVVFVGAVWGVVSLVMSLAVGN